MKRQALLLPEVVEVGEDGARRLTQRAAELADMGLVIEPFGLGAVVVREMPALLGEVDIQGLVRDLADELAEMGDHLSLKEKRRGCLRHARLPHLGARRPAPHRRGDERPAAPDGGDAALRPVQSWPSDLCRAEAGRYREAVRKTMNRIAVLLLAALLPLLPAAARAAAAHHAVALTPAPASPLDGTWRGSSDGGSCNAPLDYPARHRIRLRRRLGLRHDGAGPGAQSQQGRAARADAWPVADPRHGTSPTRFQPRQHRLGEAATTRATAS